jgi:2-polyprenyl-6-methoxyphenol hydroxylase-like FAD-dependent oxidoreductase
MIIGGGIAGPAVALALHKAGITPVVYEAHPGGADGTGAFLTVASNGMDALRVLDADRPIADAGFPTPWITLRSGTGKHLGRTPTGQAPPGGAASHTIKRSDLYRALHDQALARGISIEHGKRLSAAQDTGGSVHAVFTDGSTASADVLVGCDGIHSAVRAVIDSRAPAPRYERLLTTGGYARGVPVGGEPGSYEMIFGRRAFFGYVQAPGGDIWWFANLPRQEEPARGEAESLSETGRRQLLLEAFAEDAGPACALIEATPQIMPLSPVHTLPRLPHWHQGRMAVAGDAAHAPSPTSGQGASLSIEDGVVVAMCLRDTPDPAAALALFERARRARAERITKWAARFNSSKAAGPLARVIRDAMLPPVLKMTAGSTAVRRNFGYHLDWNAPLPRNA